MRINFDLWSYVAGSVLTGIAQSIWRGLTRWRRARTTRPVTPTQVAVDNVWLIREIDSKRVAVLRRTLEQRAGLTSPLPDAAWEKYLTN